MNTPGFFYFRKTFRLSTLALAAMHRLKHATIRGKNIQVAVRSAMEESWVIPRLQR